MSGPANAAVQPAAARFRGVLLGTAVGDALGLPAEGLSPRRARRLFPGPWRHRLVAGRGFVSDDTEHALFVAQSILAHPAAPDRFARRLAWCLRGWLLALPAGVGFATLRSILRLWVGVPPHRSGVFSAGNGPAMRAPVIGVFFASQEAAMTQYVERSTRITHTDPRALTGAAAVARIAARSAGRAADAPPTPDELAALLAPDTARPDEEWRTLTDAVVQAARQNLAVKELAQRVGLQDGVTGYIYHTVPVAAYAWYRHFGDFRATLSTVLDCGGDTDTVGAVAGALAGAVVGEDGIPAEWIDGIADWPRGSALLRRVADRLADAHVHQHSDGPVRYAWPAIIPRNLAFLAIVLAHGFRRLAPPY